MPRSNRNCCVVNCHNTEKNSIGSGIKFYSLPSRPYHCERRKRWIAAIQRVNSGLWSPSQHSRVCSVHFVGGKISHSQSHPSFVPSIFASTTDSKGNKHPKRNTRKRKVSSNPSFEYQRNGPDENENLHFNSTNKSDENDVVDMEDIDIDIDDIEEIEYIDIEDSSFNSSQDVTNGENTATQEESAVDSKSVQVNFRFSSSCFEFTCCFDNGSVGTQCTVVGIGNVDDDYGRVKVYEQK